MNERATKEATNRKLLETVRAEIGDGSPDSRTERMAKEFLQYHRINPKVYAAIYRLACEEREQGQRQISVFSILHRIRRCDAATGRGRKIDNNFSPFYARLLILDDPSFGALVELRRLQAKGVAAD